MNKTLNQIKKEMALNARSYNRHLTKEHLSQLSMMELLRNCHPIDRGDFVRQLKTINAISDNQIRALSSHYEATKSLDQLYGYNPTHTE